MRPPLQAADALLHGWCRAGRMTAETALWRAPPASLALSKSLQAGSCAFRIALKGFGNWERKAFLQTGGQVQDFSVSNPGLQKVMEEHAAIPQDPFHLVQQC